jgi:hypothetical protein
MQGIRLDKVVIAGLAAGVVMNILDFVIQGMIMADRWGEALAAIGRDAMPPPTAAMGWIVIDFLYGLLLAFAYAAVRPRFDAGPRSAVVAGLIVWLASYMAFVGIATMGFLPTDLVATMGPISLIVSMAGAFTAGKLYKEAWAS